MTGAAAIVVGAGTDIAPVLVRRTATGRKPYAEFMRWAWVLGVAAGALAAVAFGIGVSALLVSPHPGDALWLGVAAATSAAPVALGLVIARRQPRNAVGPLLTLVGLVSCTVAATDVYGAAVQRQPGGLPVADVVVSVLQGAWVWLYVPAALLVLVFPDGRLPSRRWRLVALAIPVVAAVFTVLAAMSPTPYPPPYGQAPHALGSVGSWAIPVSVALLPVVFGLLVASLVSMVVRFRRADERTRAQLKWFVLAGASVPLTLLICWASYLLLRGPDLVVVGLVGMYLAIPAATGVAMLRHDLYDVDRALSAAVTYGVLSALLLGVFTGVSLLAGIAFGGGSTVTVAAATAVSAFALIPLRDRLRRRVDRRLHPQRRSALEAIDDLRRRAHLGQARPETLAEVLRNALHDPELRVSYRATSSERFTDEAGAPLNPGEGPSTPVYLGDEKIAVIRHSRPCSRLLAGEVAAASALLAQDVRLRLELSAALTEAESSRARLLRVGYEERRRLEQDLHDGAQQRLVSLGMSLRLAQRHLHEDAFDVDGLLDQSVAELATAIAELRQLAHGLRPSSLDDGLGAALTNLTRTLPIDVDLDLGAAMVADDVSTTAYYVASEAVANAVKHAAAVRIGVAVTHHGGQMIIRISDDGKGGAAPRPGSGLAGLGDRVAAAGGSLTVSSPPGGGTVVEAELPCAS